MKIEQVVARRLIVDQLSLSGPGGVEHITPPIIESGSFGFGKQGNDVGAASGTRFRIADSPVRATFPALEWFPASSHARFD